MFTTKTVEIHQYYIYIEIQSTAHKKYFRFFCGSLLTQADLGVSGTTFERPGFQRMLRDAEAGKINCILVKDLSRLARNAIDGGYYIEKVFPRLGIRLISITDNYDSNTDRGGINLPLINLVNEIYAFDISRKTRSASRQAMKDGVYVGGQPPYGYIRSSLKRGKLLVDEPAARIVRKIFSWADDGINAYEIARRLNSAQISSPKEYNTAQKASDSTHSTGAGRWLAGAVTRILNNEIYLGRLVQGKTKGVDFRRQAAPVDEWIQVDNAHEAIISQELFEAVHSNSDTKAKPFGKIQVQYTQNLFKGKIYCAGCNGHLERTKNHDKYLYRCISVSVKRHRTSKAARSQ